MSLLTGFDFLLKIVRELSSSWIEKNVGKKNNESHPCEEAPHTFQFPISTHTWLLIWRGDLHMKRCKECAPSPVGATPVPRSETIKSFLMKGQRVMPPLPAADVSRVDPKRISIKV